jgi:hypothetical protein
MLWNWTLYLFERDIPVAAGYSFELLTKTHDGQANNDLVDEVREVFSAVRQVVVFIFIFTSRYRLTCLPRPGKVLFSRVCTPSTISCQQ